MAVSDQIKSIAAYLFLERAAQRLTLEQHADRLAASGSAIAARLQRAKDTPPNHEQLAHLIGIERWGQRRLQVALGEPLIIDEYDQYRPDACADWDALRREFDDTRQMTITLVHDLIDAHTDIKQTVRHNQYGPLTVRGWLRYLDVHASFESRRIRPLAKPPARID
ncbi:MAG: DinB family protein [Anaerolineae bacterium]|nr:DinB family protein [Anaerolineae bacterium]